jgi:subtilisin family serine protease
MLLVAALPLAACGGAGGPGPGTLAASAPAALPTPVTVPSPINYDTAEYRRSTAAVQSGAIAAWNAGATGEGVTIGFVDSGIAVASPEFAGRISPASRDVAGLGRDISDSSGHGTAVAAVAAAARNSAGPMGVAFAATLAVMRADNGSCTATGCSYTDSAIARGVDAAVAAGARVINISLGGSSANATLRQALARATASGTVVVISAGNDAAAQPDPLPIGALSATGPAALLIAGSVGADGTISTFSNRAGSAAANFLVAPGESVRSFDETGQAFLYSGTSFAAPTVAGAIALLAQAFPGLTAARLTDILLSSADDLGAPGTDPVYGRGRLNIARAMAPIGPTSLAGTAIPVSAAPNGTLGSAFGNGLSTGAGLAAVPVTDRFERAYSFALGGTIRAANPARLAGRLDAARLDTSGTALASGPVSAALTLRAAPVRDRAADDTFRSTDRGTAHLGLALRGVDRHMAARNPLRETRLSLRAGAAGLTAATGLLAAEALPGAASPGFVADDGLAPESHVGATGRQLLMADLRHGPLALALAASTRQLALPHSFGLARTAREDRLLAAASVSHGPLAFTLHAADTREQGALLGTRLGPTLGLAGGRTRSLGLAAQAHHAGLSLRLAGTRGWTDPDLAQGTLFASASTFTGSAFSAGAAAPFAGGTLRAQFALPLALTHGHFTLANGQRAEAAATSRETALELGYDLGGLSVAAFTRRDAGNLPGVRDSGAALTYRVGF